MTLNFEAAVEVIVDTSQAPDLKPFGSQVQNTLTQSYKPISDYLKSPTFKDVPTINVLFDNKYDGIAYAQNTRIVGATKYYRDHKDDIGSMVHEMTHVIQKYQNCPGWVTEGVADYMRYYHFETNKQLPKPGPSNHYTQGYWVTAYFLNYVVQRVRGDMIKYVNKDCREGTYADSIWPRLTNKDVDTLWNDMLRSG